MFNYFQLVFLCVVINVSTANGKATCNEISDEVLEEVLGPAFNPRYMSIEQPAAEMKMEHGKRMADFNLDFYVASDFSQEIEDKPAWKIKNHVMTHRGKRDIRFKRNDIYLEEWHCKSSIKWTDLGPDYFPRYQRSVECLTDKCWFGMFKCRPRSFTMKILRRKRNKCVMPEPGTKLGSIGLPRELKQLWVWEERAVTFCCDCGI